MLEVINQYRDLLVRLLEIAEDSHCPFAAKQIAELKVDISKVNERADCMVSVSKVVSGYSGDPDSRELKILETNHKLVQELPMGTVLYALKE